ncbi:MAG: MoaD/ThiS family protein [Bacteroidota bacterium]
MSSITIIAYGIAKDIIGGRTISWPVDGVLSISRLKDSLVKKYPAFSKLTQFRMAVNESYQTDEYQISPGDEVVIIPPVSGG